MTPRRKILGLAMGALSAGLLRIAPARAEPIRLLILGDSITAGFGLPPEDGFQAQLKAALAARHRTVAIIDGAATGDTAANARRRVPGLLATRPGAAIVQLGGNDISHAIPPKELEEHLRVIIGYLQTRHIPVLLAGTVPRAELGADYAAAIKAVYARVGQQPGVMLDPWFRVGIAAEPAIYLPDGIHPNAKGVRFIVARILPMVERLLDQAVTQ